jgi:hypothetical protein
MQYQEAVTEARRLVKRSEEDQWRLAQLTWEQLHAGYGQQKWADDIGAARRSVRGWAAVYDRFGRMAAGRPPYSEALQMVTKGLDDPETVYADRQQKEARSTIQRMPAEQKAEVVREALQDEQVTREVVRDPSTSARLSRAREHVAEERQQQVTGREKTQHPTSWQMEHLYTATGHLGTARHHVKRALEALREVDLDDERREIVRGDITELKDLLGWLESYVDEGGGSFDAELEKILKGGDA